MKDEHVNFHYICLLFPPLSEKHLAQETQAVEERRVRMEYKTKSREEKKTTELVFMFLFQAFDVLGDWREESREGKREEGKDGAVD